MEQTFIITSGARIGKLITNSHSVEMILTDGDLFRLEGDQRLTTILCVEGRLWITQPGDVYDHVLEPGMQFIVNRSGTVLIQGQPEGRFEMIPPQPSLN
jgi:hypothetical protein